MLLSRTQARPRLEGRANLQIERRAPRDLAFALLGERPSSAGWTGIGLITAGAVIIAVIVINKFDRQRQLVKPSRRRLWPVEMNDTGRLRKVVGIRVCRRPASRRPKRDYAIRHLEVRVISIRPDYWEWKVCHGEKAVATGNANSRETAQIDGDNALFIALGKHDPKAPPPPINSASPS